MSAVVPRKGATIEVSAPNPDAQLGVGIRTGAGPDVVAGATVVVVDVVELVEVVVCVGSHISPPSG